jgi:hypothetical protein
MISNVRQFLAAIPAMSTALLSHVGVCPACWPLVGGLISSLGLTVLVENRFRLLLTIGSLVIAIAALGCDAKRGYWPLILGIVASGAILLGKFVLDAGVVTVGGAGTLIGAYLWSFWLGRSSKTSFCQGCCEPAVEKEHFARNDDRPGYSNSLHSKPATVQRTKGPDATCRERSHGTSQPSQRRRPQLQACFWSSDRTCETRGRRTRLLSLSQFPNRSARRWACLAGVDGRRCCRPGDHP